MNLPMNKRPVALVLCRVGTGLATVRCLAKAGISVHAFIFEGCASVNYSRYCKKVKLFEMRLDESALLAFLLDYVKVFEIPPVVFPCSDEHALLLAKNVELLSPFCTIATTDYSDLRQIINKNTLYEIAERANLPIVPAISEPTYEEVVSWSDCNAAPYFVKPFYEGVSTSKLREKNLRIASREELLNYVKQNGANSLVIQCMLRGGDGFIFDCYGYCNERGEVLTIASHRRWRQHLPDTGATCFGEIPASINHADESLLFNNTIALLKQIRYHGIFGIEWLYDKASGKYYIIDFNARPFVTISHLLSCGLNLPALAYHDMIGAANYAIDVRPQLKRVYWIDLLKDIETYNQKRHQGHIRFSDWFISLLKCRSFAYWDVLDPMPGIHQICKIIVRIFQYMFKKHS